MPVYQTTAFGPAYKKTLRAQTGVLPIYLFGSCDSHTEPFHFSISQLSLTSNVATATVQLRDGGGGLAAGVPQPTPQAGAVMGVRGTTLASGAFNVDPITVTASTVDPSTGAGTITYALTHANVTAAADSGELVVWPYEYPDIVASGTASIPVAQVFTPDESDNSRCLFAEAKWFGTMPTAATVQLQVANIDQDARYYTVKNNIGVSPTASVAASDALATIAGSAVTQSGAEYSFLMAKLIRVKVSSMTGGDGTTGLVVTLFL